MAILEIERLSKQFAIKSPGLIGRREGVVRAVDGVSLSIPEGSTVAVVGETGCGKTTLARCVVRLIEPTKGTIRLAGRDITRVRGRAMRKVWHDVQMVFQDPYSSLNPRRTVGSTLSVPFRVQARLSRPAAHREVMRLMEVVGLSASDLDRFPNEFSGGQRQRIAIARAIALRPRLLVCDEPVSALDVSIQSQVLNLLVELQKEYGLAYLLISHDLAVVRQMADFIAVMYLGRIVELGDNESLFSDPRHPYTQALLSAIPTPDPTRHLARVVLQGEPPSPTDIASGCPFHPRCPRALARCSEIDPPLEVINDRHSAACIFAHDPVVLERRSRS